MQYSLEKKLRAVLSVLKSGKSLSAAGRDIGADHKQIRYWVALYERYGEAGLSFTHRRYTPEFKLSVLRYKSENGLSLFETALEFGIPSITTVLIWERVTEQDGIIGLFAKKRGRKKMNPGKPKKPKPSLTVEQQLREENEYLRAEVAYLKKLVTDFLSSLGIVCKQPCPSS